MMAHIPMGVSREQSAVLPSFLCLPLRCGRDAAVETLRKARAMPPGSERRAARKLARALRDLADTEAWLEGQPPRRHGLPLGPQVRRGWPAGRSRPTALAGEPRSLFGEP